MAETIEQPQPMSMEIGPDFKNLKIRILAEDERKPDLKVGEIYTTRSGEMNLPILEDMVATGKAEIVDESGAPQPGSMPAPGGEGAEGPAPKRMDRAQQGKK